MRHTTVAVSSLDLVTRSDRSQGSRIRRLLLRTKRFLEGEECKALGGRGKVNVHYRVNFRGQYCFRFRASVSQLDSDLYTMMLTHFVLRDQFTDDRQEYRGCFTSIPHSIKKKRMDKSRAFQLNLTQTPAGMTKDDAP